MESYFSVTEFTGDVEVTQEWLFGVCGKDIRHVSDKEGQSGLRVT